MTIQEEILDAYARELEIATCSYNMMGKMLDKGYIQRRIKMLGVPELYVYGGGYLGIQFYQVAHKIVQVPTIVDKSGRLLLDISDVPVINVYEFRQKYNGQKVIITPIKFYREIYKDLSFFVPSEQLVFLGELLGGIL